ncbi:MAG: flavodoxin [Ruminococcus sp.]|nr:flavodoxin [Ruminococcus sp.]
MKRIIIPFLMMLCMMGLSACGNSENESDTASSVTITQTEAQQTETAEQEENSNDMSAPADTTAAPEKVDHVETTGRDTIVVFFSATGTTKGVAERIANVTNADLYEIIPAEPYCDADLDWNDKNSRTTIEMNDPDARPAIADDIVSFDGYSTVYIGYPIWWGDAPRIMSTFVETHDFSGLTVIPFCTSGGSGIGRSGSNLASQAGNGNWLDGDRLDGGISEDELSTWISGLN